MKTIMMMLLATVLLLAITNRAFADETFEINKKNCNLPMSKIRKLLPDRDDQQEALKLCTEKATAERWKRSLNLTEK